MRPIRNIGNYEIDREIGRGGTAVVYLARQTHLERLVALKELAYFQPGASDSAERFLRESRLAGSLSHPNIVTVHEYFVHDDIPYIAMEYLALGSLRPHMGRLSLAQFAGVIEGILAALSAAETAGIVHRDIKPENVLISDEGRIKITDFGIAKATQSIGSTFLTAEGMTVGTPTYMAPEQAIAGEVGIWTDLFSVGILAWEHVVGHPPFHDSDSAIAILMRQVNELIPPAHEVNADVDPDLSAWIGRLLIKDPNKRTRSPTAAWDEFEEIVLARLGPRWRRDARIVDAPADSPRPLSPAAFDPGVGSEWREDLTTYEGIAPTSPPFKPEPVPSVSVPRAGDSSGSWLELPVGVPFGVGLVDGFRYLHGPLIRDEGGVTLLGNNEVLGLLKDRLLHSHGGAFLVTGFRGVGKTTVVLRALEEVQRSDVSSLEYLPIILSIARPLTTDQLLFEVVRRLFEALIDRGILESLEPETKDALLLAYARTSLAFKETSSRARESAQSLNLDLTRIAGPAMALAPKIGISRKRTDSLAREASFLAYSESDVEHDFLRIIDLLNRPAAPLSRRFRRRSARRRERWHGKLVVVLDELDKLTATPEGLDAVDNLLMSLKNILTAPNVHFIFVGGPELHDAFVRDSASGKGIYESVFACHMYVPCVWDSSNRLLQDVLDTDDSEGRSQLEWYFDFKARGIPRLLLRELNDLVRWHEDRAHLEIEGLDADRLAFYAHVQSVVNSFLDTAIDTEFLTLPIDADRWRLGAYYITDWILQRGKSPFTAADALSDLPSLSPLMRASSSRVEALVEHLVKHHIVDELWSNDAGNTIVQDAEQVTVYRLAPPVIAKLAAFARGNERERAGLRGAAPVDASGTAAPSSALWVTSGPLAALDGSRYELGDLIGVGGLGRVYKAFDRRMNRHVAVKLPAPHFLRDAHARGRWRREAEIAMRLDHPNIVRTYDVFEDSDERAGIVMELIDGPSLRALLPMTASTAVAIVIDLLGALGYAAKAGLARFDLKPDNVLIERGERAVIVDLGLVKPVDEASEAFSTMQSPRGTAQLVVGTPMYMSPEQAMGRPLDIRSDLYCAGLLLYEAVTGDPLRKTGGSAISVVLHAANDVVELPDFGVSAALHEAIGRSLAYDPDDRFPTAEAMSAALAATPEGADDARPSRYISNPPPQRHGAAIAGGHKR